MTKRRTITVDGNEAVASVAHRMSEVIAIYPITPSSAMGELSDEWSNQGRRNLWGNAWILRLDASSDEPTARFRTRA